MNFRDLQAEIEAWHCRAFDWAGPADCLGKLCEETHEALVAAEGVVGEHDMLAEELADCAVCVIAAAARAGIDLEDAILAKLPKVMAKYPPAPRAPVPDGQLSLLGDAP